MVSYLDASEIPAFVVMKWIDGINLHAAVSSGYLDDWSDRLKVASRLERIFAQQREYFIIEIFLSMIQSEFTFFEV